MLARVIELRAGRARAIVAPEDGGRLASLVVAGTQLLVQRDPDVDDQMLWGSFPMAPYAGRVRDATFRHDGVDHRLPMTLPPHAAHGTVWNRPWTVDDTTSTSVDLHCELGPEWPLGGRAEQSIALFADALRCRLAVTAGERSMSAELGWHPWFRDVTHLEVSATAMYERDADGLPTGRLVDPSPPPWDDCFVVDRPTELRVAGVDVSIASDCDLRVVFNGLDIGVAIEPQSGPPDAFHLVARVLQPGETLTRTMTIAWTSPTGR